MLTLEPFHKVHDTVSVRTVHRLGNGTVAVTLRFADDSLHRVVMPERLATFDNVTFSAEAVAALATMQGAPL